MAVISQEKINEIKSSNNIVDVIKEYINLDDKYKALCPFHDDHSPSFSVHPDKQIYKCFSCGESGNVITFVQKYEGLSFIDALKKLADRAGIKLDVSEPKKTTAYDKYYEINDTVLKYYKNNLLSKDGKKAMEYLSNRGLDKDLINEFNIGLATDNKLTEILSKKYSEADLLQMDICKEFDSKLYDTFQNRIIFPILDEKNKVIAFSGRKYLPDDDSPAKYVNSKETKIFIKSNVLYNINNALPFIKKSKEIMICEGFMDVIRASSIGYKNAVGLMSTAFTKEHLEKIIKLKCKVVLNLDQDEAGVEGTIKIGDILQANNIESTVIVFDDYKDCDEYIVHKGKEAFDNAYKNRISFIDFKLNYLKSNKNMKDSVEVSEYINEAIESLNKLDDEILKELKIKELSNEFDIDESVIKNKLVKTDNKVIKTVEEVKEIKKPRYDKYDISEIRILYLMLHNDDVILHFENRLGYLINEDRASFAYKILEFRNNYGYFDYGDFIDYIAEDEKSLETLKEINRYHNEDEYTDKELDAYFDTIKKHTIKARVDKLKSQMANTLDINKKIEIAKKIENINKEVLKW